MKINLSIIVGAIILIVAIWILFKPKTTTNRCSLQIGKEKVIFAYYNGCLACAKMKPIMEKRNDIYWLDVLDDKCKEVMVRLNLNVRAVPTFICMKNTSIQTIGAMSESAINEWVEKNC